MKTRVLYLALVLQLCNCMHVPNVPRLPVLKQRAGSFGNHQAVDTIPDTLVRSLEGSDGMRRKVESLCRNAQVRI